MGRAWMEAHAGGVRIRTWGFDSPTALVMNFVKRAVSTPAARRNLIDRAAGSVVFAVAAWQSYGHTVEVARANGEADTAHVMALSTDGLMIIGARYLMHGRNTRTRVAGGVSFALGVVATFAVNFMAATPTAAGVFMAVWPAVAMTAASVTLHLGAARTTTPATRTRRRKADNVTSIDKGRKSA